MAVRGRRRGAGKIGPRAVEPLIAALKDEDVNVRWPPPMRWEKSKTPAPWSRSSPRSRMQNGLCAQSAAKALGKIGDARAVEPLIAALKDEEWHVRKAAAEALVSLYRNASLSETAKQTILAYRSKITSPHSDYQPSCGSHDDNGGIGVDFPL
jgi:HEAT repeat protein